MYTGEVNNIALSSNDDKRLQISDRVTTYPNGINIFKACESEMLKVCEAKVILKMLNIVKAKCRWKKREIWNVFKICKSKMWKRNAKVYENENLK